MTSAPIASVRQKRANTSESSAGSIAPSRFARSTSSTSTRSRASSRSRSAPASSSSRRAAAIASISSGGLLARRARAGRRAARAARARSRPLRLGEQRVDLDAGAGADRVEQQLVLAAEVGVDRAGGEARGPGDVLHPGALVALLDEDLDRGGEQPVAGRRSGRGAAAIAAMITVIIRGGNPSRPVQERCPAVDPPVTLADVEAAADDDRGAVVATPDAPASRDALGDHRRRRLAEVREPPVHGRRSRSAAPATSSRTSRRTHGRPGVVAASAGNHAQGVAYHAHLLGIPATIVMPADTPFTKVVEHRAPRRAGRAATATTTPTRSPRRERIARETGATLVPAFDDPLVIAGQGTVGLELLAAGARSLDTIVVPVGGGGLIAGIAVAVKARAPDVARRRRAGRGLRGDAARARPRARARPAAPTIAEGIAVVEPGTLTRDDRRASSSTTSSSCPSSASKRRSRSASRSRRRCSKARARPGWPRCSSTPTAFRGRNVGVVLSGGNIDARVLDVGAAARARPLGPARAAPHRGARPARRARDRRRRSSAALRGNIVDVKHRRDLPASRSRRAPARALGRDPRPHRTCDRHRAARLEAAGLRVEMAVTEWVCAQSGWFSSMKLPKGSCRKAGGPRLRCTGPRRRVRPAPADRRPRQSTSSTRSAK